MAEVTKVDIRYGAVSFRNPIEAMPPSSKTTGNVTVNNQGSPETPAHFSVSFMINFVMKENDLSFNNAIHWETIVPIQDIGAPYGDVEAHAARQVVSELRSAADHLEKLVNKSEKAVADKKIGAD